MVESKKGYNLVNISRNSLKRLSGHLNIDRKPYAKYKNPSSSGSKVIVLTMFLWSTSNSTSLDKLIHHIMEFFVL